MENINNINNYEIIGKSETIKNILDSAIKVANTDAAVLIYGESGTGKELFARFIHDNSRRKDKKFVAINCAAIPGELLENELFGHVKGAYTDATSDYTGKFGFADEGTIFLDEIAEMSINLQAKLLRLIQFMEYQPIGGSVTVKTDIRLIAATNKNLQELLKQKKFREDLYYRLNVVPLTLPPLRERNIDIEILADYFLEIYNKKNNKFIKVLTLA
jgi:transcriptional regulator with GAF, ATPase, and Fis domain